MAGKMISQREARQLRKRVIQLEDEERKRRARYGRDYPGGTHLGSITWHGPDFTASAAYTARLLGHAVVVVASEKQELQLYAIPHPDMPV